MQAGGAGTRLAHLTANKPKCLVPVDNLPILFHLFRKYPDKRFLIIADYKKEVLREYLECFADVKYQIVDAVGSGTCAGIKQAVSFIPDGEAFMVIWSDLVLPADFKLPAQPRNYAGISQTFFCRWKYENGMFSEERSRGRGVAGLFIFLNKTLLADVPESGELVRHFCDKGLRFEELGLAGTREVGLLAEYERMEHARCRPFNKITMNADTVIKQPLDAQGERLARLEKQWYETATRKGVQNIPKIYAADPLTMERISGKNIYEYAGLPLEKKRGLLKRLLRALDGLHSLGCIPCDRFSMKEAYFGKTMDRLRIIRDLVPFGNERIITVNGRECRNVYYYKRDLEKKLDGLRCDSFTFIHGDCTFSNMLLRNGTDPILIDPRGYFGYTEIYGDPNYDYAKLYYSLFGNYDRFNLKDFRLNVGENKVTLSIGSNQWEALEEEFFKLSGTDPQTIKLLHAIIWLSLSTYAWQDYDSICGAFCNGLYYLEEVL